MGTSELYIVAYPLGAEEYRNYFMPVDKGKIQYHKIEYDSDFIEHEYLPKLKFLTACLKARKMPSDFENIQKDGD
jgi:hypothetical protein